MKKFLLTALACSFLYLPASLAQFIDSMEVNTLKLKMFADGGIGEMQTQDSLGYHTLLYAQSLWFAGLDANNSLHVSAITFRTTTPDFKPGPVSNDPNAATIYGKVYHVSLQTISDFVNGNTTGIPQEIANWPAHGNTAMGEAAKLAPFVDVDNDGNYDPSQGDYPDIKGDEALFAIANDKNHRPTEGMGLEVHAMAYAYTTGGIEDSIVYLDYMIYNRSQDQFADVYISSFLDFDLGDSGDDLPATNINEDAVFCYNGDDVDQGGFGNQPASCALRILKGPPADYLDGVDNDRDGCVDGVLINGACQPEDPSNGIQEHYKMSSSMAYFKFASGAPTQTSDPVNAPEFYNYMRSLWKNGNNLVIENPSGFGSTNNGDGYTIDGSGTKTNYVYPGDSYDASGAFTPSSPVNWFASPDFSSDFRMLANMGPFTLTAGESFDLNMAIVWSRDSSAAAGYTHINSLVSGLGAPKPVRNVSLRDFTADRDVDLFFDTQNREWVLNNHSDRSLDFKLVSISGKLIRHITIDAKSHLPIQRSELVTGIYLLINQSSGKAYKIMY
tara:strand:+ start:243 stop:1913 length:1671 start_codon:yes stop_codon:yes gene_type:complete